MRFYLGTLKVETSDGSIEKFKDRTEPKWEEGNSRSVWWTHDFEKQFDDELVITRIIATVRSTTSRDLSSYDDSQVTRERAEVARYAPGSWRTIKRS